MSSQRWGLAWLGTDAFELARCLAALRIAVAGLILISPELHQAVLLAENPAALAFVPEGAEWFARLPLTPGVVRVLRVIVLTAGATALFGYHSRLSMAVLTLAALPVYSLSQRSGAVLHDMHLFWLSALLATSACGDVWSLDAWGEKRVRAARAYAVPVAFARAFLSAVYFFPGIHKLAETGVAWAAPEQVIAQLHAKWFQYAAVPALRPDHLPWLCALGGAFVLVFELGFAGLAFSRSSAWIAALLGLIFHAFTQILLFIPFVSLWACYGVLLPWRRLLRATDLSRGGAHRDAIRQPRRDPAFVLGALLLTLIVIQGARGQTQAWPVACYPTFAWNPGSTLPDLWIESTLPGRPARTFTGRERGPRSQEEWGRVFRLSGAWGHSVDVAGLRDHSLRAAAASGIRLEPGALVRVLRAEFWTAPERWHEPPKSLVELARFTL